MQRVVIIEENNAQQWERCGMQLQGAIAGWLGLPTGSVNRTVLPQACTNESGSAGAWKTEPPWTPISSADFVRDCSCAGALPGEAAINSSIDVISL